MKQRRCYSFMLMIFIIFISDSGFADSSGQSNGTVAGTQSADVVQGVADGATSSGGSVAKKSNKVTANAANSAQTQQNGAAQPADLAGQNISTGKTPTEDKKGSIPPEYYNYRPRQSLGAVASQRKDELTGKASWDDAQEWSLQKQLGLPSWVSLTLEERVRYENYGTPWIKGTTTGQYAVPIQSVLWAEARLTEAFRVGAEFWDARSYGPSQPDKLTNSTVNAGNFAQIYAAYIGRNIFQTDLSNEIKAGQMTMDVGSRRLIARAAFRNVQYQFVGVQNRLRDNAGDWELMAFANVPEQILPSNLPQLLHNDLVWNRPQNDSYFTGAFLTKNLPWQSKAELYLYYLHEGPVNTLNRSLYSPGVRVYRSPRKGEADFEIETIGQTGTARISATAPVLNVGSIMQHVQAGYTFDLPWDPRFLAQWDYASSHFDSLYSPTVFEYGPTGILSLFNRNNINTPGYRLFLVPHRDFTFYAANRFWWLADSKSSMGWAAASLTDPTGKSGSYIGQTWELNGRWDAHDNFAIQVGWQVLMKGYFATHAPGAPANHNDVNYYYVQTEFRF
jgi:hypothetical protein